MRPPPALTSSVQLPLPPVLPQPQQTFTFEAALMQWADEDYFALVSSQNEIDQARQVLLPHGEIRCDEGAWLTFTMANYLLNYSKRDMARYFYYQVAQYYYCSHAAPSHCGLVDAMIQTAKMMMVDHHQSGAASTEERTLARAILEWASPMDQEAQLWLEYDDINTTNNE